MEEDKKVLEETLKKVEEDPIIKKQKHKKIGFGIFLALDILLVALIAYQIIIVFIGS